jgi:hypothetical protein
MQLGAKLRLQVSHQSSYIVLANELRLQVLLECFPPRLIIHHGAVGWLNINYWPLRQTIELLLVGSTDCCVRIAKRGKVKRNVHTATVPR